MARKAQQTEQVDRPADKEAAALHSMLVGIREQMEYMLREQLAQVESAMQERMKERDARIAAAESLIARIQRESSAREADQQQKLGAAEALLARVQQDAERHARNEEEQRQKLRETEALLAQLRQEAAETRAEAERQAEKMARLRQLALESS